VFQRSQRRGFLILIYNRGRSVKVKAKRKELAKEGGKKEEESTRWEVE
jgi:hypothetical protein